MLSMAFAHALSHDLVGGDQLHRKLQASHASCSSELRDDPAQQQDAERRSADDYERD